MGKDATNCKEAIALWQAAEVEKQQKANEERKEKGEEEVEVVKPVPAEAEKVSLICMLPSIKKMDNKLNDLTACTHLGLSTNAIDRIAPLALRNLKILSLGRNNIKKLEKLDDLPSLEQLWVSYNSIEKLDGLSNLKNLRTLYISNNTIKSFDELNKLAILTSLEELLVLGNPMYEDLDDKEARVEVIKRLPNLKKLDGTVVSETEKQAALAGG